MSTRSNIAIQRRNKQVEVIYCHCNGYLSYNGKMLLEHYTDLDKINNDISKLVVQFVVLALNYIFSKLLVFKNKD